MFEWSFKKCSIGLNGLPNDVVDLIKIWPEHFNILNAWLPFYTGPTKCSVKFDFLNTNCKVSTTKTTTTITNTSLTASKIPQMSIFKYSGMKETFLNGTNILWALTTTFLFGVNIDNPRNWNIIQTMYYTFTRKASIEV